MNFYAESEREWRGIVIWIEKVLSKYKKDDLELKSSFKRQEFSIIMKIHISDLRINNSYLCWYKYNQIVDH
jgi:hypothetical protein